MTMFFVMSTVFASGLSFDTLPSYEAVSYTPAYVSTEDIKAGYSTGVFANSVTADRQSNSTFSIYKASGTESAVVQAVAKDYIFKVGWRLYQS